MPKTTLSMTQADYEMMNFLLKNGSGGVKTFDLNPGENLLSLEATFEDGKQALLEVFAENEDILASIYLLDENEEEKYLIEADDALQTEYLFDFELNEESGEPYLVKLVVIPGASADLSKVKEQLAQAQQCEQQKVANQMIQTLEVRLHEEGYTLSDLDVSSPSALHASIDAIDPTGEIRCESFMDHAWEYASNFGELGDPDFEDAQWQCLEVAVKLLKNNQ